MGKCTGKCLVGVIIAIIFGALFVWTLVVAYQTHITDLWNYNSLLWYVLALIFLAIAKCAKHWGMGCPHYGSGTGGKKK